MSRKDRKNKHSEAAASAAVPAQAPDPRWEIAGAAARVILGGVFLLSGLHKAFAAPEEFAAVIEQYRLLPPQRILAFATAVPWIEIFVGLSLVAGYWVRATAALAGGLFVMFLAALGSTLARGIPLENCGCFGGGIHLTAAQAMGLDSILLCLAYCAYRFGSSYAPLDAWIDRGA